MKIAADQTIIIQVPWQVPQFTTRVNVYGNWNTNTCGGHDRMAETDARGIVRLDLDATFTALTLAKDI